MKPPHTLLAASLALLASGSLHASETSNPLVAERWQSRPLVVIAPHADDPLLTELRRALQQPSNREAFLEREMVLYTVVDGVGARNDQPLDGAQTAGLLKALGVKSAAPARVILVGKDGGKKMEETEQVVPAELFALIDKMPMRQNP